MILPSRALPLPFVALLLLTGCPQPQTSTKQDGGGFSDGGVDAGSHDAGSADAGPQYPAAFPAPPQVVNQQMGMALTAPTIVPVFFSDDTDTSASVADMTTFFQGLGGSHYWAVLNEYGVGAVASVTPATLSVAAPMAVDDSGYNSTLQQWLDGEISGGSVPSNTQGTTLYVLSFPPGTSVTQNGKSSCTDFFGYHSSYQSPTTGDSVAYVVVPRCAAADGATDLQRFTATASVQIADAVTDPYSAVYSPNWFQVDPMHGYFDEANGGSEIGDMCSNDAEVDFQFPDFDFVVGRVWSNRAVTAGHDPCVPALPAEVFFNSVPVLPDAAAFDSFDLDSLSGAVKIAVGGSATINLDLYSDAPTSGAWSVQVQDLNALKGGTALLSFALPQTSGQNGDKLPLAITVNAAGDGTAEPAGTEVFVVTSQLGTGASAISHTWYGLVSSADPLSVPQVITEGGPVLVSPVVVPIFFSNDNDTSSSVTDMTGFFQLLNGTSFWSTMTEYGVGAISASPATLTASAPTSIDDSAPNNGGLSPMQTWLDGQIQSGAVAANVQGQTLYVLNYPTTTKVTQYGGTGCQDWDGYHGDYQRANGDMVAYAVIPRCKGSDQGLASDLQAFTTTAAHEVAEGVTDPYPDYAPAYVEVDDQHIFWDEANSGSEVGDMCQNDPQAYHQFADFPYLVQRIWSNKAAREGHDPCVPALPNEVYFKAVPELNDAGPFNYNYPYVVQSVSIPVGKSATIPIDLFSDGTTGTWTIGAEDLNAYFYNGTALLTLSLDQTTGTAGGKVNLTITVNAAGDGNDEVQSSEAFMIYAQLGTGNSAVYHNWWGVVTN